MKRFWLALENNWKPALTIGAGLAFVIALLWFKLGSLTPGLSQEELALQRTVAARQIGLEEIVRHAVFLPYYLGLYVMQYLPHGYTAIRSISALTALAAVVGFYAVVKYWHSARVALMATALFATSSGLLFTGRYGTPQSMFLLLFILFASWVWLSNRSARKSAWLAATVLVCMALYVPGLIWFILPALFLQRRAISGAFRRISIGYAFSTIAASFLLLAPLALTIAWPLPGDTSIGNAKELLGLPAGILPIGDMLRNAAELPLQLFFRSPNNPAQSLGRLPLLDIFTAAMAIIGAYAYGRARKLDRSKLLGLIFLLGIILVALGGGVTVALLLPFVYLVAAEGIRFMLHEWLTVFPRNPFARGTGIAILTLAVAFSVFYHLKLYYVAWPNASATKTTFQHRI